jgi:hypothetical protein
MACQLLKLTEEYTMAPAHAVLDPTTLRKAMDASSSGVLAEININLF